MTTGVDADFDAYVRARQDMFVRFGYMLAGNRADGEDLAQVALAKLYLKWDTIREAAAMDAWVRTVMVNEHTSWWRRAWKKRESSSDDIGRISDQVSAASLGTSFDPDLWAAVMTLPDRQRITVVLRVYEDLTEAQTAEILGCSVGTVKSNFHRALATLRTRMEVPA